VLVGGEDIIRDAGIYVPGVVGLNLTKNLPAIFNQFTPVTYSYNVSNSGGIPLNGATVVITDPDNTPVYITGDVNSNNKLENNETWLYQSTRTWTWAPPARFIVVNADVDADDMQGNFSTDADLESLTLFGANVELSADKTDVCPGDTVQITMTMRMKNSGLVPSGHDAQLYNFQFSCNLLNNGALNTAGPGSDYWADPSGDYVNALAGANSIAVDADDYVDNDNGFGEADWVHSFSYVVPSDQSTNISITAYDQAVFNYYDGGTWTAYADIPPGMDTMVLSLNCAQAMQADENMLVNIVGGSENTSTPTVARILDAPIAYPNPFKDRVMIEIPNDWNKATAQVFDPMGSLIHEVELSNPKTEVRFIHEVSGMYYVKVSNGEAAYVHLLMKQ
jgi:hypothetical protein